MQPITFFLIIAIALVGYFYSGHVPTQTELPQPQETITQTQESVPVKPQAFLGSVKSTIGPSEPKPTVSIDTYITFGPKEGEVLDETNKVTFEFKAEVFPRETEGRIIFETKLEGFDEKWQETSSNQRVITLPSGSKEYTFLVRAKINNFIDRTPTERTFKINISPYFGKVKISNINAQTSSRASLITLTPYLGKKEEINITGWQIRGKRGSFVIPDGIEKYNPYYNPVPEENIFVKQNDRIYLSGAPNSLGRGRNFRPNKCLGYFTNYYNFPIPLPLNCPKPRSEEISYLSPCCQEFILALRRCQLPEYSGNLRVSTDSECVDYLNKNLNYSGCFWEHSNDEDFIGNEWHVYMNTNIVVNDDCDTIYLRDQNGLLVDKYSYGRPVCR